MLEFQCRPLGGGGGIFNETAQYSVDKAMERKAKRNKIGMRVKELEALISSNAENTFIQEYHDRKQELKEIYNYITQGIIILRSNID